MQTNILKYDPSREYFFREGCYINELSNSEQDQELSIARVRVEAGETTRWHLLEERAERYLILQGTGEVEIGDLPPTEVRAWDLVLIPSGVRQRIRNTGTIDLVFIALCTPRFEEKAYRDIST
jgi:mannose-6-phosphate isomerase-like protein (cupin superfamily)